MDITTPSAFQTPTGSTGYLAINESVDRDGSGPLFQTPTGSTGHLACCVPSIAQEATLGKHFRESLYSRALNGGQRGAIVSSLPDEAASRHFRESLLKDLVTETLGKLNKNELIVLNEKV